MSISLAQRHIIDIVLFSILAIAVGGVAVTGLMLPKLKPSLTANMTIIQGLTFKMWASLFLFVTSWLVVGAYKALDQITRQNTLSHAAALPSSGTFSPQPKTRFAPVPRIGDLATINCGSGSSCVVAATEQAAQEIIAAEDDKAGHQKIRLAEMEADGRAYRVKRSAQAVFVASGSHTTGVPVYYVLIGVGPKSSEEGWIPSAWFKKQ